MNLWHFTCEHGFAGLKRRGFLQPRVHLLAPELGPVVWLTSDPHPARDDVGLTSSMLSCDRMQHRYRVDAWGDGCVAWDLVRESVNPRFVHDAESFGKPASWWVSRVPLYAVLDEVA
jgi:hypothetical protein